MKIVAEIGINYAFGNSTGDFLINAKRLIDIASSAKCTHVKFQKRNPELSTPESQKNKMKSVPWRTDPITYLQYKKDIEFSIDEIKILFEYAKSKSLIPFASVWDLDSAEEMYYLTDIIKIPSAHITNKELLKFCKSTFKTKILSTGMSTESEIEEAISLFEPNILLHTNSTYPSPIEDLNMGYISHLQKKYPDKEIGFSNHYFGIVPMIAASVLDIKWIEFHITDNRNNWGSDQLSSVEPSGVFKLTKGIRDVQLAFSQGNSDRVLYPGEELKRESLRG